MLGAPSPWNGLAKSLSGKGMPAPPPPEFTAEQLGEAAVVIEAMCQKLNATAEHRRSVVERAWIELKSPPLRCKPTDSLEVKARRAFYRAERELREDACAGKRRREDVPTIRLGGQAPKAGARH